MNQKLIFTVFLISFLTNQSFAQFVVSDPIHTGISIASKVIHVANQITSSLELDEVLKAAEKLKKVSNGIQTFHRIQLTVKNIQKAGKHYQESVNAIVTDKHFKTKEVERILSGYETLLAESSSIIKDMNMVNKGNFLEMKDGERLEWLNKICEKANIHVSNIEKYTSSVRTISMLRSRNNNDYRITSAIYGFSNDFRAELNASNYSISGVGSYGIDNGDTNWSGYGRVDVLNQAKNSTAAEDDVFKQQMGAYQWGYGQLSNNQGTSSTTDKNNNTGESQTSNTSRNIGNTKGSSNGCMKYSKLGPYWDPNCTN